MSSPGAAETDGAGSPKVDPPAPPDVGSDRIAPGKPEVPKSDPLPIVEIEDEEDDSKGG
jgi:hypothetical protein